MALTWVDTWTEIEEGIASLNGNRFVALPEPISALGSDAVPQITHGQAQALGETWRRIAVKANVQWLPIAVPTTAPIDGFLSPDLAGRWWASTLLLAVELDARHVPVEGYTTQWTSAAAAPPVADDGPPWLLLAALGGVLVLAARRRARRRRERDD